MIPGTAGGAGGAPMALLTVKSTLRDVIVGILAVCVFVPYVLRGVWLPRLAESKRRNLYAAIAPLRFSLVPGWCLLSRSEARAKSDPAGVAEFLATVEITQGLEF